MLKEFLADHSKKNEIKKSLYRLIHQQGPITKGELLSKFDVPQTTLTRMIYELEDKGFIHTSGFGQANGGRPPVLYDIVPTEGYLVGIDIARTHVTILLLDLKFQIMEQNYFILTEKHTPEEAIKSIDEIISMFQTSHGFAADQLIGIGIGAVGPLDREKGMILTPDAFPAPGWNHVPIAALLSKAYSCSTILNNGANTAALAEYHFQPLHENNFLYCINGYGIRCGYINSGSFINNQEGDASSYGHMIIEPDGRPCMCGKKGCLTSYASFSAIFKRIEKKRKQHHQLELSSCNTVEQLLRDLEMGAPFVREAVMESAFYYGIGIANMINILRPGEVVLHGKLIYYDNKYFEEVVNVAKEHIYSKKRITIRKGVLGEEASSIGAAIQVFYHFFR